MSLPRPADQDESLAAIARDFALRAAAHDADGSFPFENIQRLHRAGLLALVLPKAYGGQEAGLAAAAGTVNAIAQGEPSTALVLAQQYLFHAQMQRNGWAASLCDKIGRSTVIDGALANMLRVEPDLGTPIRGGLPATLARHVPGGWKISGHKIYATGIPALSWLGVWAKTNEDMPRVGIFLVPRAARGIRVEETWNHMGMRASGSHDTLFDDVFIPQDHALDIRVPAEWAKPDPLQMAWTTTLFSTVYDGVARAARDWFVSFLKERAPSNLGAPLATLPRMHEILGAIDALLYTSRTLLADIASRVDAGMPPPSQDSLFMKLTVTTNAIESVSKALEVCGNPGLSRDNPLQRYYRDVLCARVHSPQNDTILSAGGRLALE